jgi:hypothetical protein
MNYECEMCSLPEPHKCETCRCVSELNEYEPPVFVGSGEDGHLYNDYSIEVLYCQN